MNSIPSETAIVMSEADADDVLTAIEEAMGCIIQQHADADPQAQDADGALRVLHRLHAANRHMKKATKQVMP